METRPRVAICICTYKREALLSELLDAVGRLTFRKVRAPQIEVVVVDNDEFSSAQGVCGSAVIPWPVRYVVEPGRGITYARNRAIEEAGPVDFLAFIDDDEVPSTEWLDELLSAQDTFAADVVSGAVLPKYAPGTADWVMTGGFFGSRRLATGATRNTCATNNVLIGTHVLRAVHGFDHSFALSGAEDTDFFLRVTRAGYKIVWSQEAVVFETVPTNRATVRWILRRDYQTGNGWVFCEARFDSRVRSRVSRLSKAMAHLAVGLANAAWHSMQLDKASTVRSLRRVSLALGMLSALAGNRFLAYASEGDKPVADIPGGRKDYRMSKA